MPCYVSDGLEYLADPTKQGVFEGLVLRWIQPTAQKWVQFAEVYPLLISATCGPKKQILMWQIDSQLR